MYFTENFRSKAAVKRALAEGRTVRVKATSEFTPAPCNGDVDIEGPWYPQPHTFYGTAVIREGYVVEVR